MLLMHGFSYLKYTHSGPLNFTTADPFIAYIWASRRENLSSGVCEQQRRRPACASAKTDQCLCYSLFGKYNI